MPSGSIWDSALTVLRTLTVPGSAVGAGLAAIALAFFLSMRKHKLSKQQVAGGALGFALGAALFAPSIAEVQVPLQSLATRWAMANLATANTVVLYTPAILLTGIVQEPAKLLAAGLGVWAVRSGKRAAAPMLGAIAGAGYGGMEAAVILSYALAVAPSGSFPWLAAVERASAVVFHLSLPGIVMFWWTRGAARGLVSLLGAVLAHIALDFLPVLFAAGMVGLAFVETVVGMISLALLAYLVCLVRGAGHDERKV
ncbi:MAG: hypothetical protein NUW12_01225 [Firmicutes bacterium]|jgi:hypothetical protein|nr:hypothetical protein [Bacillota bacterium]MDH7494568.1 hypothetical protein [Bacillota bacterium]